MVGTNVDLFIGEGIDRFWDKSTYPWLKRKVRSGRDLKDIEKEHSGEKRDTLYLGEVYAT